jgi:uncharacterized protein YbjT (DUF2867 family)
MNAPSAGNKRLVIVGGTGMVGGYALRYALDHDAVARVTAIGSRKLDVSHPKLDEVLHRDFADCSALAQALSGQDAAVFCLGTYTGAVSDAELRKVHGRLHGRVRARSPRQQPRRGFLVLEREWCGPYRTKSDGIRPL